MKAILIASLIAWLVIFATCMLACKGFAIADYAPALMDPGQDVVDTYYRRRAHDR